MSDLQRHRPEGMSHTAEELLIIYETEAEPWAAYLQSVFSAPISEAGICCFNVAAVSSRRDDFLRLAQYTCKLLILSKGMLEGMCQIRRFFLARVLSPAAHVVVLLCGVESLTPLLDLVPLNGEECLQISSEQDAHEYLSAVTDIVKKGMSAPAATINSSLHKPSGSGQMQSSGSRCLESGIVVVPWRVPCRSCTEVFILLKNKVVDSDAEVEFIGENQMLRVKPSRWNERILCVKAPDFPAGNVRVTVYSNGVPLSKAQLQYYSNMEEISSLLEKAANPVDFMCQALRESSVERLDQKLSSLLLECMPNGGFQGLQCENTPARELSCSEVPTLLHFAAQYGFKSFSSLLLQCPGAEQAVHTANRHGQTPIEIAKSRGHTDLQVLLKETLNKFNSGEENDDASVYEMMRATGSPSTSDAQKEQEGEEEEDIYAPLGVNDKYDTILNSTKAVAIANRPPAPTPRPVSTQVKEDRTPYIAKVFQKKTPQGDADLYSLSTKQAHGRADRLSSTCDQTPGPQQLIELQQRAKAGSFTVDGVLERRFKKGVDAVQQEKLSQLRGSTINNTEDEDTVYDNINIVHHTPSVPGNESRRGSRAAESDFYSKPLKGQRSYLLPKTDKQ